MCSRCLVLIHLFYRNRILLRSCPYYITCTNQTSLKLFKICIAVAVCSCMHVCWLMITCGVCVCVVYVNQCLLKQFNCVYCLTPVCMCVAACMVSQVRVCMFTNTNNVRSWEFDVVSSFWLWFYHLAAATTPCRRCLHVFLPHVFLLHVGVAYLVLISITCSFCIWLHMRRRMKAHLSSVAACNRLLFAWRSSLRCSVFKKVWL